MEKPDTPKVAQMTGVGDELYVLTEDGDIFRLFSPGHGGESTRWMPVDPPLPGYNIEPAYVGQGKSWQGYIKDDTDS